MNIILTIIFLSASMYTIYILFLVKLIDKSDNKEELKDNNIKQEITTNYNTMIDIIEGIIEGGMNYFRLSFIIFIIIYFIIILNNNNKAIFKKK